jgi:glycosyltransferase involved in cell wall biosynthesis
MTSEDLIGEIEIRPPDSIAIGGGNAVVVGGYCFHKRERTRGLALEVNGARHPVARHALPRADVYARLAPGDPARPQAYRSGFVTLVDLAPIDRPRSIELELILTTAAGREMRFPLGAIDAAPELEPPANSHPPAFQGTGGPRVAICMATYEPPGELLKAQLDSIREQTHGDWVCLISDDCSSDGSFETLVALTEDDPRFSVSRGPIRLGFYRNFERALSMVAAEADFVTLCDQDDRWYPQKLERLLGAIGERELVYSDARIVRPTGEIVRPSYWTERRNNYTNFGSLLLANSITGAASLYRRDLLADALPFPPRIARAFHDHWLAVVALARGEVGYLDEPLYDYVQHDEAVIGHLRANKRPKPIRKHLIERLRNPTGGSRAVYYYDWHQQLLFGEVLRRRCWPRMTRAKRRTLRRLLSADDRMGGLAWLLARRTRRLWGHDETLDRELFYGHALVRRRAVSAWTAGRRRPNRLLPRDAAIPPDPRRDS